MQYANRKSVRATVGRVTLGFRVTDVLVYLPLMTNDTFRRLLVQNGSRFGFGVEKAKNVNSCKLRCLCLCRCDKGLLFSAVQAYRRSMRIASTIIKN